jgi:hypothetical protein
MAGFWTSFARGQEAGNVAVDRFRDASLRGKMRKIAQEAPTETTGYTPEQAAQIRDPAEANGGQWDQESQSYRMPDGSMVQPRTIEWDASGGGYKVDGGAPVAPSRSYSLGGQTRATKFSDAEVEDYRGGRMAEALAESGDWKGAMGMRSAMKQNKVADYQLGELEKNKQQEENFQKILEEGRNLSGQLQSVTTQADEMFKKGDVAGAVTLLAQFRTNTIPDNRKVFVDGSGQIIGIDGDKLKQSDLNAYNPATYEKMKASIGRSVDEYIMKKMPFRSPKEYMERQDRQRQFANEDRDFGLKRETVDNDKDYKNRTLSIQEKKLAQDALEASQKYNLSVKELGLKGILTAAQVKAYEANAAESGAKADSYSAARGIVYGGEDGTTAFTPERQQGGGLRMVPVTGPDGKPFKGSPKATGDKTLEMEQAIMQSVKSGDMTPEEAQMEISKIRLNATLENAFSGLPPKGEKPGGLRNPWAGASTVSPATPPFVPQQGNKILPDNERFMN